MHAEPLLDQIRDPAQRPEVRGVTRLLGAGDQKARQPCGLDRRQAGRPPRDRFGAQTSLSALLIGLVPSHHGAHRRLHRPSHLLIGLARAQQRNRFLAALFQPLRTAWRSHAPTHTRIGNGYPFFSERSIVTMRGVGRPAISCGPAAQTLARMGGRSGQGEDRPCRRSSRSASAAIQRAARESSF